MQKEKYFRYYAYCMHNSGAVYRIVSLLFNWNIECWMFEQSYLVTNWFILKLILRLQQAELAGLSYNKPYINVVSIHERSQTKKAMKQKHKIVYVMTRMYTKREIQSHTH